MSTSRLSYEAPAIRNSASVIEKTEIALTRRIESDLTGLDPFGAVGFGV